ncbi:MAG: hypothetical protein ACI9WU_003437, partial [Myxococcota bacterium]
ATPLACTGKVEVTRVARKAPAKPGATGRAVLWITPKPDHPLGALDRSTTEVLAGIEALDGGEGMAIAALRKHLRDPRTRVRIAAVTGLAMAAHPDAPLALLAATEDAHPVVIQEAVDRLDDIGAVTRDALFARGIRGDDPDTARGAARLWPRLVDSEAPVAELEPRLLAAVNEASDSVAAARLIADHCGREPVVALLDAAAAHEDVAVRAAAQRCRLDDASGGPEPPAPAELLAALRVEDEFVVRSVAGWLVGLTSQIPERHHPAVVTALDAASRTLDGHTGIAVAAAQYAYGDRRGVDTLAVWVRAGDGGQRVRALAALRILGRRDQVNGPTLVGALGNAYVDPDATVRALAAEVAGRTGDGRVAAPLSQLLSDREVAVRRVAGHAIGASGAEAGIPALVEPCLFDESDVVRDSCYASLHHLVHGHALPPLPMVSEWLNSPGAAADPASPRPFWGRDWQRWRRWYQTER